MCNILFWLYSLENGVSLRQECILSVLVSPTLMLLIYRSFASLNGLAGDTAIELSSRRYVQLTRMWMWENFFFPPQRIFTLVLEM